METAKDAKTREGSGRLISLVAGSAKRQDASSTTDDRFAVEKL
jgi:hypothetical protein